MAYAAFLFLSAAQARCCVWDIENRAHYVWNVTLGEDAIRIRTKMLERFPLPDPKITHSWTMSAA